MRHAHVSKRLGLRVAVAGSAAGVGTVAMAALAPVAAHAATSGQWDRVAQCESSGNWSINSGNGYSGGLQFSPSTWDAYGGTTYAPYAYEATPAEQMAVADRVLAGQGWGAWPVCGQYAGAATGAPVSDAVATTAAAPVAQPAVEQPVEQPAVVSDADPAPATGPTYVVQPGDTLVKIAAAHRIPGGWRTLYAQNRQVIGDNPNLIFPGMHFTL